MNSWETTENVQRGVTIAILDQLVTHLDRLSDTEYAMPLTIFNGSSIGSHVRHVLEFYQCLLLGVSNGIVDYDARQRDFRLQEDRSFALKTIRTLQEAFSIFTCPEMKLQLVNHIPHGPIVEVESSLQREEMYQVEHAIHHFALLRIGIQVNFPDIAIEKDFGVAYSTIAFRAQQVTTRNQPCAS